MQPEEAELHDIEPQGRASHVAAQTRRQVAREQVPTAAVCQPQRTEARARAGERGR